MSATAFMDAALEEAALGLDAGEMPIGSVVVSDGAVWNPAAGSVAPYRRPEVVRGVQRDESLALMYDFLERAPESPFAPWARTLVG